MIKLIASDLDGTLLDNNGNIPKEFGNIIEVLNLKNIKLILKFPPICLIIIPIGGIFKTPWHPENIY